MTKQATNPPPTRATLRRPTPSQLLDGVLALGRDVHLGMDERQLAERFLRALEEMFPARLVGIRLADPRAGRLQVVATRGARLRPGFDHGPLAVKRSALAKTQLSHEAIDPGRVIAVDSPGPAFEGAPTGFSLPLVAGGELHGMLDVGYPPDQDLAAEDEPLIIPIANHLSVALRNVRLHGESALLRDYLAKLIEHADALILGVDRDWRVTVFNQAVARLTGFSRNELIGKDLREWLPPGARSRLTSEIAFALAGRHSASVDVELITKGGQGVRTVWNVAAIGSPRAVEAVVAVGQDLTQIKSLERQVIQAEKLATLGQLAAGVVHELNNPLTSIIAYADFMVKKLDRGQALGPADTEKLRRILEAAERILHFSRDLVQYARPTGDRVDTIALNDVVRQSLSFCEHILKKSEVKLVCEYGDDLAPLHGISGQLQQVVVNLVTNAVQALSPSGGRVRLRTYTRSPRHVALLVEDDGCGIPPEDRERVFEPFFTTKTDGRGTGLGLSIVRNIVEHHHGSVTVDSAPGRGTVFTVILPTGG